MRTSIRFHRQLQLYIRSCLWNPKLLLVSSFHECQSKVQQCFLITIQYIALMSVHFSLNLKVPLLFLYHLWTPKYLINLKFSCTHFLIQTRKHPINWKELLKRIPLSISLKFLTSILNFWSIAFQFWAKTSQELVLRILPKQCDQQCDSKPCSTLSLQIKSCDTLLLCQFQH